MVAPVSAAARDLGCASIRVTLFHRWDWTFAVCRVDNDSDPFPQPVPDDLPFSGDQKVLAGLKMMYRL